MYENYYGFVEKPFSLTPDPKFLYRSPSHAGAFALLQYAIRRREGFVVITGDIGTGKTTLCRALLEEIDRTTYTALVLNPFLSEDDLLKRILQDFGAVSRDEVKGGALGLASKQDLIDMLYDFLLGLVPLKASAVLIIDEAQNLPLSVLEQIRILSNLETDKEKLLQIILVGQLNLQSLLRQPELRQLDQRVSIRYQLEPLDRDGVAGYVAHRLAIAGGSGAVGFTAPCARDGAPADERHPAVDQPDLRSGAAVRLLRTHEPDHARDGGPRGREPRRPARGSPAVCVARTAGFDGRGGSRGARGVGTRCWCERACVQDVCAGVRGGACRRGCGTASARRRIAHDSRRRLPVVRGPVGRRHPSDDRVARGLGIPRLLFRGRLGVRPALAARPGGGVHR